MVITYQLVSSSGHVSDELSNYKCRNVTHCELRLFHRVITKKRVWHMSWNSASWFSNVTVTTVNIKRHEVTDIKYFNVKQNIMCRTDTNLWFLTFRGPCIVIYSYNKNQEDALFLKFILV